MKKTIIFLVTISLIALIPILCACQSSTVNTTGGKSVTAEKTQIANTVDPSDYSHVINSSGVSDALYGNDLKTIRNESDLGIEGEVTDLTYTYRGSFAYTLVNVRVENVILGSGAQPGDTITVLYLGGYIPLSAAVEAGNTPMKASDYTEEEYNSTVIHEEYDGEIIPSVGDKSIFFLLHEDSFPEWPDCYSLLSGSDTELRSHDGGHTYEYAATSKSEDNGDYSADDIKTAIEDGITLSEAASIK